MKPLSPPSLPPADAHALKRAFSGRKHADVSTDGDREARLVGCRLVVHDGRGDTFIAGPKPNGDIPVRPSLSGDGRRVAWATEGEGGVPRGVTLSSARGGLLGAVERFCWGRTSLPVDAGAAFDLSPNGRKVAFTRDDAIVVAATAVTGGCVTAMLPAVDLYVQRAADVEFLPSGRVAVETEWGTFHVVDTERNETTAVSQREFDRGAWEKRALAMSRAMPDLTSGEVAFLLDRYGDTPVAAVASPDRSRVLVQLARAEEHAENMLIHRASGKRFSLGPSALPDADRPASLPRWTADGRAVILDGHRRVPVPSAPSTPVAE